MRFDDKVSAVKHLESIRGEQGRVTDMGDSVVLSMPTRQSGYARERGENINLEYEEVYRVSSRPNATRPQFSFWVFEMKRGSSWVVV